MNKNKFKNKKDLFNSRISRLTTVPKEIKNLFTNSYLMEDYSTGIKCLTKPKNISIHLQQIKIENENNNINNENFISLNNNSNSNNKFDNKHVHVNEEKENLLEEIDEIVNELEIFEKNNRKIRIIKVMEKMAELIDEDLIDQEEITDYLFYGNKLCNIEKEHISNFKNSFINNENLCQITNKMLKDDEENYKTDLLLRKMFRKKKKIFKMKKSLSIFKVKKY